MQTTSGIDNNLIGLARVSTDAQDAQLQRDALNDAGCGRIFEEKISTRKTERPGLAAVLDYLRPGDTLCVWKLDRLGRSVKDVLIIAVDLHEQGTGLRILTGKLAGTYSPSREGEFFFTIMAAFAELERDIIHERTMAGLAAARANGRTGGRPTVMNAAHARRGPGTARQGRKPHPDHQSPRHFPRHRLQAPGRVAPHEPRGTLPLESRAYSASASIRRAPSRTISSISDDEPSAGRSSPAGGSGATVSIGCAFPARRGNAGPCLRTSTRSPGRYTPSRHIQRFQALRSLRLPFPKTLLACGPLHECYLVFAVSVAERYASVMAQPRKLSSTLRGVWSFAGMGVDLHRDLAR